MNSCPYCGAAMAARRKQCGAESCRKAHNAAKMRKFYATHGGNPHRTFYRRTCIECGREWESAHACAKYCSNGCQAAHEHGPERTPKGTRRTLTPAERRWRRAVRKLARAAEGERGRHVLTAGWCAECGAAAIAGRGSIIGAVFYCSRRCRHRARMRQRQRECVNGVRIDRQAIYARDKYRCQIPECVFPSRKLAMTKAWPHPRSPVLDHIIPQAEWPEGTVPENLRAAHNECNYRRQHHGGNDQLMLIG